MNPELTIYFEDRRRGGDRADYVFMSRMELSGFVKDTEHRKKNLSVTPVYFKGEADRNSGRSMHFSIVNEFHENVLGFCNNIYNAEGGTHLTGFKTTFTTVINTYAQSELGILKDKDANFTGADIRNGMTAVMSRSSIRIRVLKDRRRQSSITRMQHVRLGR